MEYDVQNWIIWINCVNDKLKCCKKFSMEQGHVNVMIVEALLRGCESNAMYLLV